MNAPAATAKLGSEGPPRRLAVVKIDDVLEEEHRKRVFDFLSGPGWQFGWKSDPKKDPYSFWHKHFAGNVLPDHHPKDGKERPYDCAEELSRTAPFLHEFWTDLQRQVTPGHMLTRCYANGQPYGSEGAIHTDSTSERSHTLIYYPHAKWHPNWGGETLFFDKAQTDVIATVYPRPNRLVLFEGTIPHVARGVTRVCPALRITLMFKTERRSIEAKYRDFLIEELKVHQLQHSGRDFYTHLSGTYELLRAWGNSEPVCLAGLFHSIYGTWHFRHKAFPIERREVVRELIGEEAESLAYAFCVSERPKCFLEKIRSPNLPLTDRYLEAPLALTSEQFIDLLEIEAANLLEQGGNIGDALRQLAAADISTRAKGAIERFLGRSPG